MPRVMKRWTRCIGCQTGFTSWEQARGGLWCDDCADPQSYGLRLAQADLARRAAVRLDIYQERAEQGELFPEEEP